MLRQNDDEGFGVTPMCKRKQLVLHYPRGVKADLQFSMNGRIIIMFFATHVRVAITSANLEEADWNERIQCIWTQEFPKKGLYAPKQKSNQASYIASDFEHTLVDYMAKMGLEKVAMDLGRYDFSDASVFLITSVPDIYSNFKYGHMKVRRCLALNSILTDEEWQTYSPPLYLFSETEGVTTTWFNDLNDSFLFSTHKNVQQELLHQYYHESAAAESAKEERYNGFEQEDGDTEQDGELEDAYWARLITLERAESHGESIVVWPTASQVQSNKYGLRGSLHYKLYDEHRQLLQPFIYKCRPIESKKNMLGNAKLYTRFRTQGREHELAWVLMSSADLSAKSWGMTIDSSTFQIQSFDIGVLFIPKRNERFVAADSPSISPQTSYQKRTVRFPLPIKLPPRRQLVRDEPFTDKI